MHTYIYTYTHIYIYTYIYIHTYIYTYGGLAAPTNLKFRHQRQMKRCRRSVFLCETNLYKTNEALRTLLCSYKTNETL